MYSIILRARRVADLDAQAKNTSRSWIAPEPPRHDAAHITRRSSRATKLLAYAYRQAKHLVAKVPETNYLQSRRACEPARYSTG